MFRIRKGELYYTGTGKNGTSHKEGKARTYATRELAEGRAKQLNNFSPLWVVEEF